MSYEVLSERQEEDLVSGLLCIEPSVERPQAAYPATDAYPILRRERDAGMLDPFSSKPQEVLVVSAENLTLPGRIAQMIGVFQTQPPKIPGRDRVNP